MADKIDDGTHAEQGKSGVERVGAILAELADAARSAAEALLDDQKQQTAERIAEIAGAVHSAAQSLDRSDNSALARSVARAGDQVEGFSRLIRDRRWSEIAADADEFARRQPILFALGATLAGFAAGRLFSAPADRQPREPAPALDLSPHRGETDEITAAVSQLAIAPTDGKDTGTAHVRRREPR
jgi:NTP pyrophosphatase (non-canonical NTP hydrolase)